MLVHLRLSKQKSGRPSYSRGNTFSSFFAMWATQKRVMIVRHTINVSNLADYYYACSYYGMKQS